MQPEGGQPVPQPVNPVPQQPQDPAAVHAFESTVPHPVMSAQPVAQPMSAQAIASLSKPKRDFGSLLTVVLLVVALLGALGFGGWAFMSRQDYKSNSDKKSAEAVEKAEAAQKVKLDAEYAEQEKQPYDTYTSKPEAGSIGLTYPKTWSAYIVETQTNGGNPVVGYLHPGFVPNVSGEGTAFALRFELLDRPYSDVIKQFDGDIKLGKITASAYQFPKVPSVTGIRVTGTIVQGKDKIQGTMVVMQVRDKTLRIWTESNSAFLKDFDTAILPNLTFTP